MEHVIKIEEKEFARVLSGDMPFQVRKNDRDYQGGDSVVFIPIPLDGQSSTGIAPLGRFVITYVHRDFGMAKGYVVFGITSNASKIGER